MLYDKDSFSSNFLNNKEQVHNFNPNISVQLLISLSQNCLDKEENTCFSVWPLVIHKLFNRCVTHICL